MDQSESDKGKIRAGFYNVGEGNTFINPKTTGYDFGFYDGGKSTLVVCGEHTAPLDTPKNKHGKFVSFLLNPWVITVVGGLVVSVTVLLISYYYFGIGKTEPTSVDNSLDRYQSPDLTNSPGSNVTYASGAGPEIMGENQTGLNTPVPNGYQQDFDVVVANPTLNLQFFTKHLKSSVTANVLSMHINETMDGETIGIPTGDFTVTAITNTKISNGDLYIGVRALTQNTP